MVRGPTGRRNLYDVLGVKETASGDDIKRAYIAQSKLLHPDTAHHHRATSSSSSRAHQTSSDDGRRRHERFVELVDAYGVLKETHSRRDYDQQLKFFRGRNRGPATPADYDRMHTHRPGASRRQRHDFGWYDQRHDEFYRRYYEQFYDNYHKKYRPPPPITTNRLFKICFVIMGIGTLVHLVQYNLFVRSVNRRRAVLDRKDAEARRWLAERDSRMAHMSQQQILDMFETGNQPPDAGPKGVGEK